MSTAINHEIEAGRVGAWPLSNVPSVPVLQKLCCYVLPRYCAQFTRPEANWPGVWGSSAALRPAPPQCLQKACMGSP